MPRKLLALATMLAMLTTAFEAGAVVSCTAGNPNASVIESTPTSAFTVHGDTTVTHTLTGLMWKQCAQGASWNGSTCLSDYTALSWSAALAAAAADTTAGYSDWRLPNRKELESIVENCGYLPSINQTVFPNTVASFFWSASSYATTPANAWYVYFFDGNTLTLDKTLLRYVRLVRGGQLFDSFDAQGGIVPPVLTAVGVSGTTATATTLSATSDEAATGYWIVVPQGSTAPTAAQVKAGANYGTVTLSASGNGAMVATLAKSFSVTGLSASTAYDLYLVAEDSAGNHNLTPTATLVQFSTQATPSADLAVTNSDTPDPVMAGSNLAYTVTVANNGPDAAASASWSDTLPAGTTFVSLVAAAGWSCTTPAVGSGGTVSCNNASQAVGSAAFTLTLAVAPGTAAGTVISNTASATSATADPSPGNNSSTATTTVAAPAADLAVTNSDTPDPVMAGSNLTYTVTVTNNGPDAAASASWSDTLPAGTSFVSLTSPGGWSCATPAVGSGGTVTCNNASQAVGSAVFTLTLAVAPATAAGTVISNTASVTSATADPSPGNNSSTATTTVAAPVAITSYTAPSATATGNITASFSGGGAGCGFTVSQYIPLTGHAASPPAGSAPAVSFPHGLFDFTTGGCTQGSTITMTITYPQTLLPGTTYWKYGPTPTDGSYHWYQLPATIVGNTATFSITDGGLGDDDLAANGIIVDQGGPGVPSAPGGAASIPTLSEWALLLLAGLMGLFGMGVMRRRKVPGL